MWVMRRGGDGGRGAYAVLERAGALIACDESVLIAQEHASRARARGGLRILEHLQVVVEDAQEDGGRSVVTFCRQKSRVSADKLESSAAGPSSGGARHRGEGWEGRRCGCWR